uniref:NADH dehydrogenase subunit 6 n=1 Tax=Pilophorus fibula TaxID=2840247 RepID=UPI0022FD95E9|nr:NADH dehydrogenase subunit 6 [Pilophorus fibula]WBP64277.1 NADH dehydrogenase subunit 6 [Pilophorus fibula]
MFGLLLVDETFTNGYRTEFLSMITFTSILSAIFVIISKNPIVSVLFLIGLFISIACYLFILGLNFIGLSYLLVYVGAVSILFLFILMLINVRISELSSDSSSSIPLALIIVISFNLPVYGILPLNSFYLNVFSLKNESIYDFNVYLNDLAINYQTSDYFFTFFNFFSNNQTNQILYVTSKFWDGSLAETTHITSIGNIMYTTCSLWLVITSIILLLAMVGAIVITIKQKD